MESMSVTLDEVIAAARARAASLVPETSGYLALAVADASARLPFAVEDPLVTLSTEGTVHVKRGSRVAEPADSASVMRDMLGRLLSLSIGSAPALAGAARTRSSSDAVDVFIHELENALVPVNRAAARRALARLARETVRAKEAGRLRKRRRTEPTEPARPAAPTPASAQQARPEPHVARKVAPPSQEPRRVEPAAPPVEVSLPTPAPAPAVAAETAHEPTPAPVEIDVEEFSATPHETPALAVSDTTTVDTEYADRALLLEPIQHSDVGGPARSDVDALAMQFSVTQQSVEGSHRIFKSLAGMEPTPPPPKAAEIAEIVARSVPAASPSDPLMLVVRKPRAEERGRIDAPREEPARVRTPAPAPADARGAADVAGDSDLAETSDEEAFYEPSDPNLTPPPARASRWPTLVALVVGFCIAASLGHFVPSWLAAADTSREP